MSSKSTINLQKGSTIHQNHTFKEILGQPFLWKKILHDNNWEGKVKRFLLPLLKMDDLQIILTGAGSSAFVGEAVETYVARHLNKPTKALPTTLLVTHFKDYLDVVKPTLFISYARSGNSPESSAIIDLAQQLCTNSYHIAVTCNPNGSLATKTNKLDNAISVILPEGAEDKGLAMTGSFTGMILTTLLICDCISSFLNPEHSSELVSCSKKFIKKYQNSLLTISKMDFDRAIFLGSGPLKAIAKESHLKVQELTDGEVVGKYDSFLGFRHGPKAVSNSDTIIFCLFSSDEFVFRYERDLVIDLINNNHAGKIVGVFMNSSQSKSINFSTPHEKLIIQPELDLKDTGLELLPYVIPAQLIGYFKSLYLKLDPDNPSRSGAISRVVEGVQIYKNYC